MTSISQIKLNEWFPACQSPYSCSQKSHYTLDGKQLHSFAIKITEVNEQSIKFIIHRPTIKQTIWLRKSRDEISEGYKNVDKIITLYNEHKIKYESPLTREKVADTAADLGWEFELVRKESITQKTHQTQDRQMRAAFDQGNAELLLQMVQTQFPPENPEDVSKLGIPAHFFINRINLTEAQMSDCISQ